MKNNLVFIGLVFLVGCSSVKYKVFRQRRIVVEVPSKDVSVHCTAQSGEEKNRITYLNLRGKKMYHRFIFRRAWPYENCLQWKKEINAVLAENRTVIVVGHSGELNKVGHFDEPDDQGYIFENKGNLAQFSWMYDGVRGKKSCSGYFTYFCEGAEYTEKVYTD